LHSFSFRRRRQERQTKEEHTQIEVQFLSLSRPPPTLPTTIQYTHKFSWREAREILPLFISSKSCKIECAEEEEGVANEIEICK
jgi:hypothetical protein